MPNGAETASGSNGRKPAARRAMANYYRAIRRHRRELRSLLRPIDIPAMLIWGERDPVFLRGTTERFDDWVPHCRVERIPKAGHFVQTDAAARVNELLLGFWSSDADHDSRRGDCGRRRRAGADTRAGRP